MPSTCHSIEPSNCIDYIYANGAKIAKANPLDAPLHISGDNCYSCGGTASYVSLSSGAGYVIQAGDALNLTQYNAGDSVGGLILRFADGSQTSGLVARDQNGQQINCDALTNQLHNRHIDLSAYAGETLASTLVIDDVCSPGGHFDLYLNDIAIVGGSGQVTTIYSPQLGATYAMVDATAAWPGPVANMRAVSEPNTYVPAGATHYYIGDHLGTTQMEFAGGGWPLWQGSFAPFGQEVLPGVAMDFVGPLPADGTAMHYKFTGKERDTESGLDYFGARYYASNMGRWMSPDWNSDPRAVPYADFENPQSLNLYSYVRNNPLSHTDPDGHHQECAPDTSSTGKDGSITVTAGACHEVADHWYQIPSAWLQNVKARMDANAIAHAPPPQKPNDNDALNDLANVMMGLVPVGPSKSPGNLQRQVEKGQAPKSVDRVDKGRGPFEKDHIEFKSGDALNQDGTWKHGGRELTGEEAEWVQKNGWNPPPK